MCPDVSVVPVSSMEKRELPRWGVLKISIVVGMASVSCDSEVMLTV